MNKLEIQIADWERIKDIFDLAKNNEGALKTSFHYLAHRKVKEYYDEYGIKYDPCSKPKRVCNI